jgi:hypothetical protein
MSAIELLEPFLEQGIRNTNFFNGRLLSAEDLRAEQEANRQQHQQLGRALGEGVAYGLEVRKACDTSPPSGTTAALVKVSAGLAVNRRGQALYLPTATEVALVREKDRLAAAAGLFAACEPPQSTAVPTGTGVYILILAPASGFEGRALMSGLGGNGATGGSCGSRFAVEGVQFRLVALNVGPLAQSGPSSPGKLRNLLAHFCFGTEELAGFPPDPFRRIDERSPYMSYGPLDALRALGSLTDCDVPLALLHWTQDGIQFIDPWPVRRRLVKPASDTHWPLLVGDRRLSEAEAMFLQFQDHIVALQSTGSGLANLKAEDYFTFLPAAGYLPTGVGGFNWKSFLGPMAPPHETLLDAGVLRPIVHRSFFEEPIPVGSFTAAMQPNLQPPVPVDVYQVPAQLNVVLFARSTSGRIRVFLSPANVTPQQLYAQAERSSMQLNASQRTGNVFPIVDLPPGGYTVDVVAEGFAAIDPIPVTVVGGRTTDVVITLQPIALQPTEPKRCIDMELFGRQVVVCMQPDALTVKRPTDPGVRALETPSRDAEEWLNAWRDWLIAQFPTMDLDPGVVPTIFIDTDLPRQLVFRDVSRKLALYAEFAPLEGSRFGGARIPLSINPSRA